MESSRGQTNPLEVIFHMICSPDPVKRDVGGRALQDLPAGQASSLLADPGLSPEALDFFARHAGDNRAWREALERNPALPEAVRGLLVAAPREENGTACATEGSEAPLTAAGDGVCETAGEMAEGGGNAGTEEREGGEAPPPDKGEIDEETLNLYQRIQRMTAGEKIKLALRGDKEARTLLLKDSNREVYMSVMENPGITESEVEMISKNTGTNADILRAVAKNREWMANHAILKNFVTNPKTPVNIALQFLGRLGDKELEIIDKSRNLNTVLRTNANRILAAKRKKKG